MSVANVDLASLADKSKSEMDDNSSKPTRKRKQIPFSMVIPPDMYDLLNVESNRLGISKKAILMDALRTRLGI